MCKRKYVFEEDEKINYFCVVGQAQMTGKSPLELKELLKYRKKDRGSVTQIANRLGNPDVVPDWLLPTDKNLIPKSACIMFPKPPKGPGN